MPRITIEEIEHLAKLARLRLSEIEREKLIAELEIFLDYVDQLEALQTDDVDPTYHVTSLETPMRSDLPGQPLSSEYALGNAPDRRGSAFAVPKVLEADDEG